MRSTSSIIAVAALVLAGCGSSGGRGANACVEGTSQACACTNGADGAQLCSGGSFEPCVCDGTGTPDASADTGAEPDAGAAPDATTEPDPGVEPDAAGDPDVPTVPDDGLPPEDVVTPVDIAVPPDEGGEPDVVVAPDAGPGPTMVAPPLYFELIWDTPGDPDQTDTGPEAGADLDLHLVLGEDVDANGDGTPDGMFAMETDCHYNSKMPDWGDSGADDDPVMVLDDTDGAGPEQINYESPPAGETLTLYVHYWNDHGFGPSTATLRLYDDVGKAWEASLELTNQQLWVALVIDTTTGVVTTPEAPGGGPVLYDNVTLPGL